MPRPPSCRWRPLEGHSPGSQDSTSRPRARAPADSNRPQVRARSRYRECPCRSGRDTRSRARGCPWRLRSGSSRMCAHRARLPSQAFHPRVRPPCGRSSRAWSPSWRSCDHRATRGRHCDRHRPTAIRSHVRPAARRCAASRGRSTCARHRGSAPCARHRRTCWCPRVRANGPRGRRSRAL